MNKLLPLGVITSMLLTGCGGSDSGGSSSPSAPKYTWQMIHLYETDKSNVGTGCAIFEDVTQQSDSLTKVMAASVATTGYKVLIHDEDGSFLTELSISSGQSSVVINSSQIPENGYVTLEEVDQAIGQPSVYTFSLQKDLLQDLVLNVRNGMNSSNSCYKGTQQIRSNIDFTNNAVEISNAYSGVYHQTSYIDKAIAGQQSNAAAPVQAPLNGHEAVLATVYSDYVNNKYQNLLGYSIIPAQNVYDKTNSDAVIITNLVKTDGAISANINNNGNETIALNSSIEVIIDNHIYQWQPIYDLSDTLTFFPNESKISKWAANINLDYPNQWQGNGLYAITDEMINLINYNLSNFSSTTATGLNLDSSGFNSSEFTIQRTHVKGYTTSDSTHNFYQTIFAKPNKSQVFIESSRGDVGFSVDNSSKIEVTLGDMDISKKSNVSYFLNQFMDTSNFNDDVNNGHTVFPEFYDVNGSVLTDIQINEAHRVLMADGFNKVQNKSTVQ